MKRPDLEKKFPGFEAEEVPDDGSSAPSALGPKHIRIKHGVRAQGGRVRKAFSVTITDGDRTVSMGGHGNPTDADIEAAMAALQVKP